MYLGVICWFEIKSRRESLLDICEAPKILDHLWAENSKAILNNHGIQESAKFWITIFAINKLRNEKQKRRDITQEGGVITTSPTTSLVRRE